MWREFMVFGFVGAVPFHLFMWIYGPRVFGYDAKRESELVSADLD